MAESELRIQSKNFAKQIITECRTLRNNRVEMALINQLLRSGTSIGANIHEAQYAQGTKDFISKLEIALKECNETEYWLELLVETGSIHPYTYQKLYDQCVSIRKMLISSVLTTKKKAGII